jgi:predicted nucleic acid-binding protein
LIDEWAGRQTAERLGLHPLGVLGLIVRAKKAGLLQTVKPLIAKLEAEINFFVSDNIRNEILRDAGE